MRPASPFRFRAALLVVTDNGISMERMISPLLFRAFMIMQAIMVMATAVRWCWHVPRGPQELVDALRLTVTSERAWSV